MTGLAQIAAIFAGGEGRRMGGADKGAVLVADQPLWRRVTERLAPQARRLAVLAPTPAAWMKETGKAIWIADAVAAGGPGAGLLGALRHLEKEAGPDALLLTAPVDAPFLPHDLFEKLEAARARASAPAAIVRHADGLHPVFGLWKASCSATVEKALRDQRALHRIASEAGAVECEAWKDASPDPFANLNSPEDVAAAETLLRRL
jgi:molybdopterin-guanine dinucleotide biosynthesis protein A